MKSTHAIVIGGSSGIGRELVRQLAANGTRVAVLARQPEPLSELGHSFPDRVYAFPMDVRDFPAAPARFAEMCDRLGGLDLFIYCAGVMPEVGPREFNFDKDREMIEINDLGAVRWLNLAAERFQAVGGGVIVGIGSVAGDRGRAGQPVYNASKAFLHTFLEALRNRLATSGVKVTTIKPGPTDTPMTAHLGLKNPMPADEAARRILAAADSGREKYLSTTLALVFLVIRNIPSAVFRRLKL